MEQVNGQLSVIVLLMIFQTLVLLRILHKSCN